MESALPGVAWAKKYELVTFKGSKALIFKEGADGDNDTLALDRAQVVSHHGRVFEDLLKIHIDGGHCKAKTFLARIKIAHGKSILRWMQDGRGLCQLLPSVRAETAQEAQLDRAQAHPNQGPR